MVEREQIVTWTSKARKILALMQQKEQEGDNLLREVEAIPNLDRKKLEELLHFSGPRAPWHKDRRLETRTILTMLVAGGHDIDDLGALKEQLYAMGADELEAMRENLRHLHTGDAEAPKALKAVLGADTPLSRHVLGKGDRLRNLVAKLPPGQASIDALVHVEEDLLESGDRWAKGPPDVPVPARSLTTERHDILFRRKTDLIEQKIQQDLGQSTNPKLRGLKAIPAKDVWKTLIDGKAHAQGDKHFYDRSKGYMASMMTGLGMVVENIDEQLSVDFVKRLHTCATHLVTTETNVGEGMPITKDKMQEEGIKRAGNAWGVCKTFTKEGMQELQGIRDELDRLVEGGYFAEDEMRFREHPETVVQWSAGKNCKNVGETAELLMDHVIKKCYAELGTAQTPDEKIGAIIDCCRGLGVIHPFKDANGRLIMFLTLNKLLMENGLEPTTLEDQGFMVGRGKAELIQLIKRGQQSLRGG